MKFIADLHVHSKFSRATAKNLDLENMYIAAQHKGIKVVGTGDFTHPRWFSEIRDKLIPAEQGLFKLRNEIEKSCDEKVFPSCRQPVRFMLVSEISNIYKKEDKTRKNHNLVFLPDMESALRFNKRLETIGNIASDGRPILGLDARNLLEIVLETSDQGVLIPAHIWTPWFSMLGSKSGFDNVSQCFSDLTPHIFAVETGLSSDPEMNWRVSFLDRMTLISNSDAHSPFNLGRESNNFNTDLSYNGIMSAIKTGDPKRFLGTNEFYPEEGKYHMDGHRKCDVCFSPDKTRIHDGMCPKCGKPLTRGVLNRVEALSDRVEGEKPGKRHPYFSLIPLSEILSEIFQKGVKTKQVQEKYDALLEKLGPEFEILNNLEKHIIEKAGVPLLGEAILRMRDKAVTISPGYDGVFGKITVFKPEERIRYLRQRSLFKADSIDSRPKPNQNGSASKNSENRGAQINRKKQSLPGKKEAEKKDIKQPIIIRLNDEQRRAVEHETGPMLIVAGPGTGKTRTITHRIAYLIQEKGVSPEHILAVTFTHKAAKEMLERLEYLSQGRTVFPFVTTFHSFCFTLLKEQEKESGKIIQILPEEDRFRFISEAVKYAAQNGFSTTLTLKTISDRIVAAKQNIIDPDGPLEKIADESHRDEFALIYRTYQDILAMQGLYDYEDLIFQMVKRLETDQTFRDVCRKRYKYIFIDEYQDINNGQYRIIRALSPRDKDLCAIGDPDQSIYGFRGSDVQYFQKFLTDYPDAKKIRLTRNYRSSETILQSSQQVIRIKHKTAHTSGLTTEREQIDERIYSGIKGDPNVHIIELATDRAEAVAVGMAIETMVGGAGFHFIDFEKAAETDPIDPLGFSDFAVLYRTHAQRRLFSEAFDSAGIPYQIVSRSNTLLENGVPEIISYLKITEGYGSFADFDRLARRLNTGVGTQTRDAFFNWSFFNRFSLKEAMFHAGRFPIPNMARGSQLKLNDFIKRLRKGEADTAGIGLEDKLIYIGEKTPIRSMIQADPKSRDAFVRLQKISQSFKEIEAFLTQINLFADTDAFDEKAEKVSLMTLHAAKGLEFPVVFITGCDNRYIPFQKNQEAPVDIDEERRLFYVAMTRAKQRLYLTRSKKRRHFGQTISVELSPFVQDIEKNLRNHETFERKKARKSGPKQLQLFE